MTLNECTPALRPTARSSWLRSGSAPIPTGSLHTRKSAGSRCRLRTSQTDTYHRRQRARAYSDTLARIRNWHLDADRTTRKETTTRTNVSAHRINEIFVRLSTAPPSALQSHRRVSTPRNGEFGHELSRLVRISPGSKVPGRAAIYPVPNVSATAEVVCEDVNKTSITVSIGINTLSCLFPAPLIDRTWCC